MPSAPPALSAADYDRQLRQLRHVEVSEIASGAEGNPNPNPNPNPKPKPKPKPDPNPNQVAALLLLVTYAPHHAPALVQRACSPRSDAQLLSLAAALAPRGAPPPAAPLAVATLLGEAGWGAFDATESLGALDEAMPMATDVAEPSSEARCDSRLARLEARAAQLETLALLAALLAELARATEPGFTRGSLAGRHEPHSSTST